MILKRKPVKAQDGKLLKSSAVLSKKDAADAINYAKDFVYNYISSDKYADRLLNALGTDATDFSKELGYRRLIANEQNKDLKWSMLDGEWGISGKEYLKRQMFGEMVPRDTSAGTHYNGKDNAVFIYDKQLKDAALTSLAAHEFGHAFNYGVPMTEKNKSVVRSLLLENPNISKTHDLKPTETRSDVYGLRAILKAQSIYDAGKEDFTKKHIRLLEKTPIKKEFFYKRLRRLYPNENAFIKIMNIIVDKGSDNKKVSDV